MEFILDRESEPALEVEDDLESTIQDIGGWSYLLRARLMPNTTGMRPSSRHPTSLLSQMDAWVLAEQYGSEVGRSREPGGTPTITFDPQRSLDRNYAAVFWRWEGLPEWRTKLTDQ